MKISSYASDLFRTCLARGDCAALTLHPHFEDRFSLAEQRWCFLEHTKRLCSVIARSFCGLSRRSTLADWLPRLPEFVLVSETKGRFGGEAGFHAHGVVIFRPEHGANAEPRFRALLRKEWGEDADPLKPAFEEDLIDRYPVPSSDRLRFSQVADRHHRPSFHLSSEPDEGWLAYDLKHADDDYELLTTRALVGL